MPVSVHCDSIIGVLGTPGCERCSMRRLSGLDNLFLYNAGIVAGLRGFKTRPDFYHRIGICSAAAL
jgi:hypothetical protein